MSKREILAHEFNVWVSREDSQGMIYKLTSPIWLVLTGYLFLLVNFFGWGIYGIVALIGHVV